MHYLSCDRSGGRKDRTWTQELLCALDKGSLVAGIAGLVGTVEVTAVSTYRMTVAGETFYHYGYGADAGRFGSGLRPNGWATTTPNLSGAQAWDGLSLPRATMPDAVYTVTPQPGTWIRVNPTAGPLNGHAGGLPEVQFPYGTGPSTVSPPRVIR